MVKRFLAATITACMMFGLVACGGGAKEEAPAASTSSSAATESESAAESTGEKLHIGFAVDTYNTALCAEIAKRIEEECKNRGYDITVTDGEGDASKQIADVAALIQKGVDGIVILPVNSYAVDEAIETAYDAGVPIATVLRDTPNVEDKYVCFSGVSDITLGEIGGQWVADALGGKGKVVYITGRTGITTAEDRTTGFHNILDQYPDIEIVAEQDGNYSRADAMSVMETILKAQPEIDAVWCANDEMAGGACQAISAAGRQGMLIGGANFQADAYDRLKSGEQTADITTPPMMVYPALDAVVKVATGGTHTEKKLYYDLDLITADNADDFLDQLY